MTLIKRILGCAELCGLFPPNGAPALSAFTGATLLFIGNIVWLGSRYRRRFRADNAIAAACYLPDTS